MTARLRGGLALGLVLALALGAVSFDASGRRADADALAADRIAFVEVTGSADLALSSGARWLRHATLAEPAAACVGPTCLDTDPAGLALPPPRETFGGGPTLFRVPAP